MAAIQYTDTPRSVQEGERLTCLKTAWREADRREREAEEIASERRRERLRIEEAIAVEEWSLMPENERPCMYWRCFRGSCTGFWFKVPWGKWKPLWNKHLSLDRRATEVTA